MNGSTSVTSSAHAESPMVRETGALTEPAKPKLSPAKRKRRIRRIMKGVAWVLLVCLLAAAGWWYYTATQDKSNEADVPQYARAAVRQGPFDVYVYGSGAIVASSQPVVYIQTEGKLTDLRVSVGDVVAEGQILAVLQNDALNDEIASLEYDLWSADNTITTTSPGSSVSAIVAPSAGRVMQITAASGDDALAVYRRLGSVAMLSTDGRMKVALDVADGAQLGYGEVVTVSGEGFVREGSVTDLFLQGSRAVVTVVDDKLPLDALVTVTAQGVAIGQGRLEINKPMAVSAFGGTIKTVRVKVGDTVARKQEMFTLEDSPITLKVENLRLQRETAAESLRDARDKRENLIVRAPVAGVVATVEASEGNDVAAGDALCSIVETIVEGEDMVLTIAVDELDVVKVAEGQTVKISVDALPDLTLMGEVQKIAPVGTSSSGVSTYDVKLSFDSAGAGVRPGMNASGQVQVAHVDNTLYVPVEALMTMNNQKYLMVADGGFAPQYGNTYGNPYDASAAGDWSSQMGGNRNDQRGQGASGRGQGNNQNAQYAQSAQNNQFEQGVPQGAAGNYNNYGNQGQNGAWNGQNNEQNSNQSSGQNTAGTGSLRAVTVGLVNDDYAEILSGVSAGEIVLYQNSGSAGSGNRNSQYMMRDAGMPRIIGF